MDEVRHVPTDPQYQHDAVSDGQGADMGDRIVEKPNGKIVKYVKGGRGGPQVLYDPEWQKYYDAYMEGLTLQQVGDRYGVSRERVRQLCEKVDSIGYEAEKQRRKQAAKERAELRRLSHYREVSCYTCDEVFLARYLGERVQRHFCCREHHAIWQTLSLLVDDERWEQHKRALVQSPSYPKHHADTYKNNVLNDTVKHKGRWLIEGSKVFWTAVECCIRNWPIFQDMPLQIQKQVRDYVDRLGES